ncbi:MAG TPA: hypothetical protein VMY78_18300 [Solirubrobacteraceae bacterium]|nr:hypothetical protein [Solirubrobacteraceae bacterium]
MSTIAIIIALLLQGLIVGALARLALPGRDPMSIPATIGIGIGGSFLGGLIAVAIFGANASFLFGFAVAVGIVYLVRRSRGGGLTDPGAVR